MLDTYLNLIQEKTKKWNAIDRGLYAITSKPIHAIKKAFDFKRKKCLKLKGEEQTKCLRGLRKEKLKGNLIAAQKIKAEKCPKLSNPKPCHAMIDARIKKINSQLAKL